MSSPSRRGGKATRGEGGPSGGGGCEGGGSGPGAARGAPVRVAGRARSRGARQGGPHRRPQRGRQFFFEGLTDSHTRQLHSGIGCSTFLSLDCEDKD